MKMPNYHLYLTDDEYSQVVHCLVELKNKMMEQGRYTDVIDEVLLKFSKAKKKKIKIAYR
ncbi:MAG: hypothetical protein VZR95_08470 [Alphaproteobacteria bacterium]